MMSLTSLNVQEFFILLEEFDVLWRQYHARYDLKGKPRVIEKLSEHASMSLKGSADKLFFVLFYLKQNTLQSCHGFTFNMSQGKVSQWLGVLMPLLAKALQRLQMLPARDPGALYLTLQLLAGQLATERAVPRSVDWERQKHEYSGKKGCHTNKNLLVSDEHNRVLYLSPTVEGSLHDKALADEVELEFVPDKDLLADLGFVGYKPQGTQPCLPVKRLPNQELSELDKQYNQLLASIRVKVEHVMAGVKRVKIVKDKIRLKGQQLRDQVMLIACGLQNLRVSNRNLS
ncbi:transposase family protein [Botryobacter ruber]|uniref:transposase family protein n=1 Tax=Botryobacter ruber TaxID=2171629 RepID=UPI0013E2B2F5|nr:transposase family protein [Botryobacter ruber]